MCGFVAIIRPREESVDTSVDTLKDSREKALKMSARIRHRGPDWSGVYCGGRAVLAHERLAIVDPMSGGQPLYSADGKKVNTTNYNSLPAGTYIVYAVADGKTNIIKTTKK